MTYGLDLRLFSVIGGRLTVIGSPAILAEPEIGRKFDV
jgi:hypothetical protein